jgi:hypothetical protein
LVPLHVVLFAHECPVRHDVELVARVEGLATGVALEAVQVEDAVLGLADQVVGVDNLLAAVATRTETSGKAKREIQFFDLASIICFPRWVSIGQGLLVLHEISLPPSWKEGFSSEVRFHDVSVGAE